MTNTDSILKEYQYFMLKAYGLTNPLDPFFQMEQIVKCMESEDTREKDFWFSKVHQRVKDGLERIIKSERTPEIHLIELRHFNDKIKKAKTCYALLALITEVNLVFSMWI